MSKFNILIFLIVPFLILTSCTTISVIPIGDAIFGSHEEKVLVYANRSTINKEYEEIAIITAKVDAEFGIVDDEATMSKILSRAQSIGAHAVIFEEEDISEAAQSIRVTAIRFTE
ncbi:MAG: hypothetical protein V3U16_05500 [Candidatus Neomarinimicrobiota bacterium]